MVWSVVPTGNGLEVRLGGPCSVQVWFHGSREAFLDGTERSCLGTWECWPDGRMMSGMYLDI